jgi:putative heme-binding domain-containing protein
MPADLLVQLGCLACHALHGRGGSLGPDLSSIGLLRSPASLRQSLLDPGAVVHPDRHVAVATLRSGQRIEGLVLNHDDLSLQLRLADGSPRSLLRRDIADLRLEPRSLMPSQAHLPPDRIDALVAALASFRDRPASVPRSRPREIARVSENLDWMRRPSRDADERPEALLDAIGFAPGSTVVDLGCGAGFFAWRLAGRVGPGGRVIAVDVQRGLLDLVGADLARRGIRNVELRTGSEVDPGLPPYGVDTVLAANSYHEFSRPREMLAAVRRSLRPGGRLVVVEYAAELEGIAVGPAHRMSFDDIVGEVEAEGFELDRIHDVLPSQHALEFRKAR